MARYLGGGRPAVNPRRRRAGPFSSSQKLDYTSAMDEAQIQSVLESLVRQRSSWIVDLPASYTFHAQPVLLEISTEARPTIEMLDLARLILANLERILMRAEQEFVAYHAKDDPNAAATAKFPHIHISEEGFLYNGPRSWDFVVCYKDYFDYDTHLEFEGTEFDFAWDGA